MSLIGSIFSFECKKLSCCKKITRVNTNDDDYQSIYEQAQASNILLIPATNIQTLKSLFPETNHVHLFSILVVGKNREYILVKLNGDLRFNGQEKLVNNKQNDSMPTEIRKVLDGVWDKTINDAKSLQFLMVYKGICYLCNSYPFLNESKEVIGAICFLRNIDLIQNAPRLSVDRSNTTVPTS